ncbi:MAG TPA: ATP-binding protein [Bacilli bacterium]
MKRCLAVIYVLIVAFIVLEDSAIAAANEANDLQTVPQPALGVIDLRGTADRQGTERIALHGEWEFHWKRLLEPADWQRGNFAPAYLKVPASWRNFKFSANAGNSHGYGTYRLLLLVPASDIGENKALFIRSISSAYRLWIDGKEQQGLGKVGTDRHDEVPQSHINLVVFQPKAQTVEVVIQVSNFSFREGGIIDDIVYGDTVALLPGILKEELYDLFVIGGFVMIGLYLLVIFGMRKKDLATLFAGLACLGFAARTIILNGYLSSLLLGVHNWEALTKLEYISEIFAFLCVVLLMKLLYPREAHRAMVYLSLILSAFLVGYVLFTPARIFTETLLLQSAAKVVVLLYFVCYVSVLAFIRKREGAVINMVAVVILAAAIANDTLFYLHLIDTVEVLKEAAILFLLAQAAIVSYRYAQLSRRNDLLVKQLGSLNATLEEKVAMRTQKLHEANQQLSEMRATRTKMLVNIAHDLSSPLVGMQTYLQLMEAGQLPSGQREIARMLLAKTAYIQRLIQDLFELAKLESGEQKPDRKIVAASDWLRDVCAKLESDLLQNGFQLRRGRIDTLANGREAQIFIDSHLIMRAVQNYIDNAQKFSRGISNIITLNCYIERIGEHSAPQLVVEIVDYGMGIAAEELPHVFRRFYKRQEANERGSGLGLAIVQQIIEQHQGTVGVKSEPGKGSTFFFLLPIVQFGS